MKRSSVVVKTVNGEGLENVDFQRVECRDTHISCITAKSLAEPPKACRSWEGLK
jgi:hypothetical protein